MPEVEFQAWLGHKGGLSVEREKPWVSGKLHLSREGAGRRTGLSGAVSSRMFSMTVPRLCLADITSGHTGWGGEGEGVVRQGITGQVPSTV